MKVSPLPLAMLCLGCLAVGSPESDEPESPRRDERAPSRSERTHPSAARPGAVTRAVREARDAKATRDGHWAQREDEDELRQAIEVWQRDVERDRDNLDALVMLARAHLWLAEGHDGTEQERIARLDAAVAWAEKALVAASPEFAEAMADGAKLPDAMAKLDASGVPALYWYSRALGAWATRKGFAVYLGQRDNLMAARRRVVELDPTYFHGGALRELGSWYAIAPAFAGGDLAKSRDFFERSFAVAPDLALTRLRWAAELSTKTQDRDEFERLLAEVAALPDDAIPGFEPEQRLAKRRAAELLAAADDYF